MKAFSLWFIFCCLFFAAQSVFAQFGGPQQLYFATNGNALTVIGYDGNGFDLVIPSSTNGLPITSIADGAFEGNSDLNGVGIPDSITNIGSDAFEDSNLGSIAIGSGAISIGGYAFGDCLKLADIEVDPGNTKFSSVGGVLFDKTQTTLIQFPDLSSNGTIFPGSSYAISNGVRTIGDYAFAYTPYLRGVTIPASVTSIGQWAFYDSDYLNTIFFQGNAPSPDGFDFGEDDFAIAYYLPGTIGWSNTYAGIPALLWNPQIQAGSPTFGLSNNQFGFTITGTTNLPISMEACSDLAGGRWTTVQTCLITNGSIYFSDPTWTNYPSRFYRINF